MQVHHFGAAAAEGGVVHALPETVEELAKNYTTVRGEDIQALAVHPQDLNKLYRPKPLKGHQRPELMACVRKTSADEVTNAVRQTMAHPVNLNSGSQLLDDTGPEGLQCDDQGMAPPHSILGDLKDFRSHLEAKGKTHLAKRIPNSLRDAPLEATGRHRLEALEKGILSGQRNIQNNALQHWDKHMRHRRRQQDVLSDLLERPVENLLMNQANHFRETQEQREFLNQVMPLIHSGYGYRVGSEFWSLPQRYGDEMSGITATLTRTEQGRREPVTHMGQLSSIRQESGVMCAETVRPASRTWGQSAYLQHQRQELREVLDMDINKPDISGLEVIGSGKPFTFATMSHSPLLEKEEEKEHKEMKNENLDPLAQHDDVHLDVLLIPALRFYGQLASWTGNSTANQGEVGISATIVFEALTAERASSHLELHNEGSTAIHYSWQRLPVPHSFPNLRSQTMNLHFCFNSSSGVIYPGETQRVEFIFKPEEPGVKTELWQLNTHPVLLQGASLQVTLSGVALYQDKTTDQMIVIEQTKLEKTVLVKMCQSIVHEVLQGVHTPERPSSPAELYITQEQQFLSRNPKLQFLDQPVEDLKRLWQEVNQGHTWDLSVDTLRQVVLSLPDEEPTQDSLSREQSLAQLNSLLLQFSEPSGLNQHHLTAATIGQQLWGRLLDTMAGEAMWLRKLLGLPERETWIDDEGESIISDADLADSINKDEKSDKKERAAAKEERSGARSDAKSKPPTTEKSVEENKTRDEVGKHSSDKLKKESASLADTRSESISQQFPDDQIVDPDVMLTYKRLLHKKVYALMEDLVDNLCEMMDDLSVGDEQNTHTINT